MQRSEIVMILLGVSGATLLTLGGLVAHVLEPGMAATKAGERADVHIEQASHGVVAVLNRDGRADAEARMTVRLTISKSHS